MWRTAIFKGVEKEAKTNPGFLVTETNHFEDRALQFLLVRANGTASELVSVQDHVIGLGERGFRALAQLGRRAGGLREWMMRGRPASIAGLLKHGPVRDPAGCPAIFNESKVFAELVAQCAH